MTAPMPRLLGKIKSTTTIRTLVCRIGFTLTTLLTAFQQVHAFEIRERILRTIQTGEMAWHINDRWGFCLDLPTRGLHDFAGIGTQLVAGYSYRYFRGAPPLPCNEKQNRFYQVAMDFDLSDLRPVSIVSAHLELQGEELAFNRSSGGVSQTCWFQVSQADESWNTGSNRAANEAELIDTTGPRVFANLRRPVSGRFQLHRIDVTRIISRIANNPRLRRQGFVLEATRQRMDSNETAACVRAFSVVRLRIRTLEH